MRRKHDMYMHMYMCMWMCVSLEACMRKKIVYTIPASARFIGSCPVPKSPNAKSA